MNGDLVVALTPAVPLLGTATILLLRRRPNAREAASVLTSLVLAALVVSLVPGVLAGGRPAIRLLQLVPAWSFPSAWSRWD